MSPAGDRELFVKQLTAVLEAPEPDVADVAPELRLEKKRARKLLSRVDEFFRK